MNDRTEQAQIARDFDARMEREPRAERGSYKLTPLCLRCQERRPLWAFKDGASGDATAMDTVCIPCRLIEEEHGSERIKCTHCRVKRPAAAYRVKRDGVCIPCRTNQEAGERLWPERGNG